MAAQDGTQRSAALRAGRQAVVQTGLAAYTIEVDPAGHVRLTPPAPAPARLLTPNTARQIAATLQIAAGLADQATEASVEAFEDWRERADVLGTALEAPPRRLSRPTGYQH